RFFKEWLPDHEGQINELVRSLVSDLVTNPALHSVRMSECVPVEVMNIVLASSELPPKYRLDLGALKDRILSQDVVDYFSCISLLFYFRTDDPNFTARIQSELDQKFLP